MPVMIHGAMGASASLGSRGGACIDTGLTRACGSLDGVLNRGGEPVPRPPKQPDPGTSPA